MGHRLRDENDSGDDRLDVNWDAMFAHARAGEPSVLFDDPLEALDPDDATDDDDNDDKEGAIWHEEPPRRRKRRHGKS